MDDQHPHLVGHWMRELGRLTEPFFTPPGERQKRALMQAPEARREAGLAVAKAGRDSLVLIPAEWQAEADQPPPVRAANAGRTLLAAGAADEVARILKPASRPQQRNDSSPSGGPSL